MRKYPFIVFLLIFSTGYTQEFNGVYNQSSKISLGYTGEQLDHYLLKNSINDTGSVAFNFKGWLPSISYTHEFIFGKVMSINANIGFQYMNLEYGGLKYGGTFLYTSIQPQATLYHSSKFEFYMKLKLGGIFYFHEPDIIPEPARRFMPEPASFFTGVSLAGFNFLLSNNLGINLELSIWSPEMITAGLSYRFFGKKLSKLPGK